MPSDIGVAIEGLLRTLAYWSVGAVAIPMVVLAMILKSWMPIVIGLGTASFLYIYINQRREDKKTEAAMRGFPISPELQAKRFEDYIDSLHKTSNE